MTLGDHHVGYRARVVCPRRTQAGRLGTHDRHVHGCRLVQQLVDIPSDSEVSTWDSVAAIRGESAQMVASSPSPEHHGRPVLRVLLEARPGVGKTTVTRRLLHLLHQGGVAVAGFTAVELREAGQRIGFAVETVDGARAVLAHVDLPGPPRVGKYGVDVVTFERLAVPALAVPARVVVIDELGKMELASAAFRETVHDLFTRPVDVVATVHAIAHPVTDELKTRSNVDVVRVTADNRDALPNQLRHRLLG
jgi:nucleoside-triphosphatase